MKPLRGITLQLLKTLMKAGVCSVILLAMIIHISDNIIIAYFPQSVFERKMTSRRVERLSNYISEHNLSATDHDLIQKWCDKQPMVLMEVYRNNYLLFHSNYNDDLALSDQNIEATYYDWYSYYKINFSDGSAEILFYSDESYVLQTMVKLLAVSLAWIVFLLIFLYDIKKIVRYIYLLTDEISIMGNGDFNHSFSITGNNELTVLAAGLEKTRKSLISHRQTEEMIIRQNQEMITGLSHDLRTPLTKIMLCVEILQGEKYRNKEEEKYYLKQAYNNSCQLKAISEHILQYSLSQKREDEFQIRKLTFQEAFFDIISEAIDYFICLGFEVDCDIDWVLQSVKVIDLNVRRIMDKIVSNIEKYADRCHPVSITSIQREGYTGFEFKNKKINVEKLEGHHVGLVNLQSMLRQMEGFSEIEYDDDYFKIKILFHVIN